MVECGFIGASARAKMRRSRVSDDVRCCDIRKAGLATRTPRGGGKVGKTDFENVVIGIEVGHARRRKDSPEPSDFEQVSGRITSMEVVRAPQRKCVLSGLACSAESGDVVGQPLHGQDLFKAMTTIAEYEQYLCRLSESERSAFSEAILYSAEFNAVFCALK
mmetsp:Transcript_8014/g.17235  ORF Transcript_8014/g.17235 Transcript_8014/m.17235 type:complete len:162 (-) Transcript_8014:244-729(-)|eukprot:CAMPEP_0185845342 /NCGR_PEP_ID=MMETSP1354-20130828/1349_1 /TAXON_ID=708628 /ORGANISM="Erythrolobus madagascarensis, Strain CCMP3276" /LENGTH=161 /DNA_ID=CAMNT_0028545287 /DNA_START=96 /DNA_END=581 /DNA_ORIENTATION=-